MYTSLIEVSTSHLNSNIPVVSFWFLSLSLLERLLFCLVFWEDSGNLLAFSFYNLETSSALQKSSVLHQYLIPELLEVFQLLFLLLLLCNSLLFDLLPYLGLCLFPCFLSCTLSMMDLCCFFQTSQKLLLFLVPLLQFMVLLFEHFGIVLEDVGENRKRHCDIEERGENFSFKFIYCWPRHYHMLLHINSIGLWINSIELWRLSPKEEILLYTKSIYPEYTFSWWYYLINISSKSLPFLQHAHMVVI